MTGVLATGTLVRGAGVGRSLARVAGFAWGLVVLVGGALGCADGAEREPPSGLVPTALSGGETTSINRSSSAFEDPAANLDADELAQHLAGDVAFEATFVTAPADVNPGLGPTFNNTACSACHTKNGRGLPVTGTGPRGSQLLVRVSAALGVGEAGGPAPYATYGTQLQDHAITGHTPEARVELEWQEVSGAYGDGTPYLLRRPQVVITLADGSPLPANARTSPRIPPPVFGLGLLEAVPEAALLALEDPDDRDGDGISGRVNRVWSAERERLEVGRFGWKANTPTLRQQAAGAYLDDMGVANPLLLGDHATPDIDDETLSAATFYTQTLAVPRRVVLDRAGTRGVELFHDHGCASCHTPELRTGAHSIAALADQLIAPYTDLLLHDLGPELADDRPDFAASGTEWRTPPLWGIGVTETVLGEAAYLHDGRARTLEEAILWHGGEAEAARERFRTAPSAERAALVAFLLAL